MFAEVILNRRTPGKFDTFTYKTPEKIDFKAGQTVLVPLKKSKVAGVIIGISDQKPAYETREILEKISEELLISDWQIQLARYIADYYLCPLARVIPMFLPKKIWQPPKRAVRLRRAAWPNKKSIQKEKTTQRIELTPQQAKILKTLEKNSGKKFLLHGVTGSGKTEIYARLAKKYVLEAKQALILVPEISLTPQLIEYFQNHFDEPISVIHSKLSETERRENWLKIFRKQSSIIIGSRSALFAPFQKLGLIVMDEEHEWTYKQDQTPKYHARKVAEKMSELTGATLLLGSATPDVAMYFKTRNENNIFRLLELPERIDNIPMPKTTVVDMREEMHKGNFSILSDDLREKLTKTLANKKQTILFINRRGIAPAILCRDCGYIVRCPNCRVAMVTHKSFPALSQAEGSAYKLICHHCGFSQNPPVICPLCQSYKIRWIGIGTERVEEEIKKLFSLAKVFRADSDTILKKQDHRDLYKKLKNREIDILIGTQMIGKGLDLPHVHLVGVILADTSLHFPDFRAAERTFQLITQVAGRAGRSQGQGEVVIQTYNPEHYAVSSAAAHDYKKFFDEEIRIRKEIGYPPFSKIIKLSYSDASEEKCGKEVEKLENSLKDVILSLSKDDTKITSSPAEIPYQHKKFHWNIFARGKNPEAVLKLLLPLPEAWRVDVL